MPKILSVDIQVRLPQQGAMIEHIIRMNDTILLYSIKVRDVEGRKHREIGLSDVKCILCPLIMGQEPAVFEEFEMTIHIGGSDGTEDTREVYSFGIEAKGDESSFVFREQRNRISRVVTPYEIRKILNVLLVEGGHIEDFDATLRGPDMCRPECEGRVAC
ncbi:MAG TPA: hypothetical protein VN420_04700 [Candidatus Fimivivens sp.]|nr:hypothetical protein [Candidatus Fimivivens sp.]